MYKKFKGSIERHSPLLVGALSLILVFVLNLGACSIPNTKELLSSGVNVASISVGFLIASISVMVGLKNNPNLTYLQIEYRPGLSYLDLLKSYLKFSVTVSFIYAISSAGLLMFNQQEISYVFDQLFKLWIVLSLTFLVSLFRIIKVLANLLDDVFK
ncbi:hypothetical protein MUO14_24045 [Halobacillus shinanisalinarum]|uniref:Uncharacterized protein n=1 Tax=Halobacillus shinanisalinarum TaxID=2932258 RepID=A0ABY4GZT3_9BACI|nr:hypothetical protein [Halobacillus shinanisalinarum]UOQ93404.1 hypothetical protein MUO14_24045 [Halobacillus shinanisalinarum]